MQTADLSILLEQDPSVRILDVRTPGEYETAHINGAYNVPLDLLGEHATEIRSVTTGTVVLVCQSGQRAARAEALLKQSGMSNLRVLEGGMNSWLAARLPVVRGRKRLSLERQVRILAGSIVALGSLAALIVSPAWAAIPALIGSGLVFAGLTDRCGMALLLARLPYNRARTCDAEAIVRQFLGTAAGDLEPASPQAFRKA